MNIKPIVLGLSLAAGLVAAAQAQVAQYGPAPGGSSVASLPPGPRTNSNTTVHGEMGQTVVPSGAYPGPGAGAGNGQMPPRYQKPADWDSNLALHPYTSSGVGPKAH